MERKRGLSKGTPPSRATDREIAAGILPGAPGAVCVLIVAVHLSLF